ncbi:hypothetical protein INT45_001750 [Circinella minor]|uniref:Uncharacterized protein n=1 Tax=Circinella minor TaxID=1195481 RepID=A0A8H7S651_9FUNG|nr:hypothetical protein INT45_001750 [Circinella minor]
MTRAFFSDMFIPLQNCLFFEICRTLITKATKTNNQQDNHGETITNDNNNITTNSLPTRAKYAIYTIYVAYLYTVIFAIISIAYCVIFANSWSFTDVYTGPTVDPQVYDLAGFTQFGVWGYVVFIVAELILAYKQLRPCINILLGYAFVLVIENAGRTASGLIDMYGSCSGYSCTWISTLISFILQALLGLLGLIYVLYVSPRYLPSQPKQASNNPQQIFTYAPVTQQQQYYPSSQPAQMFTGAPATGSSTQVNQQLQYPIVQIPQHQFSQQGQYQQQQPIIVQLPITQQPVNQQYPIVQLQQQAATGYYNTNGNQ